VSEYKINKAETIKHLSEKLRKLKSSYDELKLSNNGHKLCNEELKVAVQKAKKALNFTIQKEKFLTDRIVKIYGRQALKEILNHVDCPGGFDSVYFDECSRKIAERGLKAIGHSQ